MNDQQRVLKIASILDAVFPRTEPYLDFHNSFELLIAVIMSAQTTDSQVNKVTPALFSKYPSAEHLAAASLSDVKEIINSTGFYKTKARNIIAASAKLLSEYSGAVPESIEDLTSLPGVGRKTANVIRGICFGYPSIIVDTHFARVNRRLGFTASDNPDAIEAEIRALVPEELQTRYSMTVNSHGRFCCKARKPECAGCAIKQYCPYPNR